MKKQVFNLGDKVYCDVCDTDYTESSKKGGITYGSKAVCPVCAPTVEEAAIANNEVHLIRYRCPSHMSFANWVRNILRAGQPGTITITQFEPGDDIDKILEVDLSICDSEKDIDPGDINAN